MISYLMRLDVPPTTWDRLLPILNRLSLPLAYSLTLIFPPPSLPPSLPQETSTAYSHLEPLLPDQPEIEDDSQYRDLGDIEPNDLITFAYQIAIGMVNFMQTVDRGYCTKSAQRQYIVYL